MVIHNCAGKILVRQNKTPVDGFAHLNKCLGYPCIHLVHLLKGRLAWHSIHVFIQGIMVITNTCML